MRQMGPEFLHHVRLCRAQKAGHAARLALVVAPQQIDGRRVVEPVVLHAVETAVVDVTAFDEHAVAEPGLRCESVVYNSGPLGSDSVPVSTATMASVKIIGT